MAGDPDYETSLAILRGAAGAGADVIEIGMPFTDPMADGPAIQAAGLRALKAGQTLGRRWRWCALSRQDDADTPIVLMGYYNPIYLRRRALPRRRQGGRRRRADRRRPAARGGRRALPAGARRAGLNFIRLATPTTDDKRLPRRARQHLGLRLLRLDHRHHRRRRADDAARSRAAVARIKRHTDLPVASASASARPSRRGHRRRSPTASWSARRWSTRSKEFARRRGQGATKTTVSAVTDLSPPGRRPAVRRAAGKCRFNRKPDLETMNWITNVVRPKIRSLLNKREVPENLWIKCPETGQMVFHRDLEANHFVIPGSGYHMRMSAQAALRSRSSTRAVTSRCRCRTCRSTR
jgi:tryptophan synthase alpha chain